MLLVFPNSVFAQTDTTLLNVNVQLWPEYDQPSMLVITDFGLPASVTLPVDLTFRIPKGANLIAVASYNADGVLANAAFEGPKDDGDWQSFTVTVESPAARFEYYQPLTYNGDTRTFSYLWNSSYAVDAFDISVMEPVDVLSLTSSPKLDSIEQKDGLTYHRSDPVKLAVGKEFSLKLEYKKSTDTLVASPEGVQPVAPVDENTPGRVSLNNSLPYLIGGLGVILIVGGLVYYLKSGNSRSTKKPRARRQSKSGSEEGGSGIYCAQCGTRAHGGDRFCRTCGARLRQQEE
jgi:hypothetical protein